MRCTKIEFQGDAGHFAVLTRDWTSPSIQAQVITPAGSRADAALAADREGRWNLAVRLQAAIDGFRGCKGDVAQMYDAIERLAD